MREAALTFGRTSWVLGCVPNHNSAENRVGAGVGASWSRYRSADELGGRKVSMNHTRKMGQRSGGRAMFEVLELRRLLSGNVTAVTTGAGLEGTITLTGDNKSNDITIGRNGFGDYLITGNNGTTVNGAASVTFVDGHFRNIIAKMGNGDDVLTFAGDGFNSADVEMGNGKDTVNVGPVLFHNFSANSAGNLSIDTGNGEDSVTIDDADVEGNLDVSLGNGPDSLTFIGATAVTGTSNLSGGHGPDDLFGTAPAGSTIVDF